MKAYVLVNATQGRSLELARRIRDLPGVQGDQVCKALIASGAPTRVLMLTAASTIRDRVEGLELGADDYLPKPFEFPELVARVRALRRRAVAPLPPTLARADVNLDPSRRVAFRGDRRLPLTPKEFALLECLLAADGRVVSAEELLARVWDEAANPFTTTVKTTVGRLRAKLGSEHEALIGTVRNVGYRFVPVKGERAERAQGTGTAEGAGILRGRAATAAR